LSACPIGVPAQLAPACLSEEVKVCIGCGRCLFCNDCEEKIDPDGCLNGGHALRIFCCLRLRPCLVKDLVDVA